MERFCPVIEKEKVSAEVFEFGTEFSLVLIPALDDYGNKSKPTINETEIIGLNDENPSSYASFYYNGVFVKQGDLAIFHDDSAGKDVARIVNGGDLEIATKDDVPSKYSKEGIDLVYNNGE